MLDMRWLLILVAVTVGNQGRLIFLSEDTFMWRCVSCFKLFKDKVLNCVRTL